VDKGCVVVGLLLQASPQQAQLVPVSAVLAGLQVVLSVRATVHSKSELCAVEREGFQQEAESAKADGEGLVAGRLPRQFVTALEEKSAVGFRDREMCV
jgi:hypothetical protein